MWVGILGDESSPSLCLVFLFHDVLPDSAISPPILMSCSSHTEVCNELETTDRVTSH